MGLESHVQEIVVLRVNGGEEPESFAVDLDDRLVANAFLGIPTAAPFGIGLPDPVVIIVDRRRPVPCLYTVLLYFHR